MRAVQKDSYREEKLPKRADRSKAFRLVVGAVDSLCFVVQNGIAVVPTKLGVFAVDEAKVHPLRLGIRILDQNSELRIAVPLLPTAE